MYALILAGGRDAHPGGYDRTGVGAGLGPAPTQRPSTGADRTPLQETAARVLPIIPPERVFVATGTALAERVAEQLPEVPRENILVEPIGRGTAPCIGLAALHLLRRDPDAVMAVLPADHRVEQEDMFCGALVLGEQMAEQGYLVTLGIEPTSPATAYGYIEHGRALSEEKGRLTAYTVARFTEKPTPQEARELLARGGCSWNAGMFVWRADRILEEIGLHRPALADALSSLRGTIGAPAYEAALRAAWEEIDAVSIDVAVLERTECAAVIPVEIGWSDVGGWTASAADGAGAGGGGVGAQMRSRSEPCGRHELRDGRGVASAAR